MARRNDHSREELHAMALDAALAIVEREGYGGLSARKVAREMGYTVGTLYLIFQNLDDLVLQANGRTLDALSRYLLAEAQSKSEPADRLAAFAKAYVNFSTTRTEVWGMLYQHPLPEGQAPQWYRQKVRDSFAVLEADLRRLGPKRDSAAITRAATILWAGVHGICILGEAERFAADDAQSTEVLALDLVQNFLRGWCQTH